MWSELLKTEFPWLDKYYLYTLPSRFKIKVLNFWDLKIFKEMAEEGKYSLVNSRFSTITLMLSLITFDNVKTKIEVGETYFSQFWIAFAWAIHIRNYFALRLVFHGPCLMCSMNLDNANMSYSQLLLCHSSSLELKNNASCNLRNYF